MIFYQIFKLLFILKYEIFGFRMTDYSKHLLMVGVSRYEDSTLCGRHNFMYFGDEGAGSISHLDSAGSGSLVNRAGNAVRTDDECFVGQGFVGGRNYAHSPRL